MSAPLLSPLEVGNGRVRPTSSGWTLSIPSGPARSYRLAQLDNYHSLARRDFPSRPPVTLSLEARVTGVRSGTWGFGWWNNPFGLALSPFRGRLVFPAAPQAAWFFWASTASHLSFRDDLPANGMLAQSFRSDAGWRWFPSVALQAATRDRAARASVSQHVAEASRRVAGDPRSWRSYEIHWTERYVEYLVDGHRVFKTDSGPRPPLGLVLWIDNQYAAFDPPNRMAWGFEETTSDCRLEIRDLRVATPR